MLQGGKLFILPFKKQIPVFNRSFRDYKKPIVNDSDVAWQQCA